MFLHGLFQSSKNISERQEELAHRQQKKQIFGSLRINFRQKVSILTKGLYKIAAKELKMYIVVTKQIWSTHANIGAS